MIFKPKNTYDLTNFIHCNISICCYAICPSSNNGSRNKPSNSQKSFYTFVAWLWDEEKNAEAKWSALFWQWEVFKSLDWWFSCRKGSNNSSFTGRNVLHYSTFIGPNIIMGTFLLYYNRAKCIDLLQPSQYSATIVSCGV